MFRALGDYSVSKQEIRHGWTVDDVLALFDRPLNDLLFEAQALCFMAGAGSIFCGDRLLTTPNPEFHDDMEMFEDLGLAAQPL